MGAFEAIAMIGTSYVLISLYRALSHIERRYQAVWHGSKKYRRNRAGNGRGVAARNGKRPRRTARDRMRQIQRPAAIRRRRRSQRLE